jgi:hypothetical protein
MATILLAGDRVSHRFRQRFIGFGLTVAEAVTVLGYNNVPSNYRLLFQALRIFLDDLPRLRLWPSGR